MARYLAIGTALTLAALALASTAFGWRRIAADVAHDGLHTCRDGARANVGNTPGPQLRVVVSSPPWIGPPEPDTTIATRDLTLKSVPVFAEDGGGVTVVVPYTGSFGVRFSQQLPVGETVGYEFLQPGEQPGTLDSVDTAPVEDCFFFSGPVPANDGFGASTLLTGPVAFAADQHNANASKQTGEPDHAGDAGGRSLWYRWTAPVSGVARVNTCGSDFDTVLAVYTGSSLGSVTKRASDDDGCGHLDGSRIRWSAQRGTTYRIAVDGFGGDMGTFDLGLELSPGAATFGPPFDLSDPKLDAANAHVAIDADGDATFVWLRFDGSNSRVQTRTMTAAGNLSPVQTLSSPGRDAQQPGVAVDADGDAMFTWFRFDGTNTRVQARTRSAAGVLGGVQNISDPGQNAFDSEVAVDPNGNAAFVWPQFDGSIFRIKARTRSAAGVLGPVHTLSQPGQNTFNLSDHTPRPRVAVDGDGDAVFVWGFFDGSNSRIQTRALSGGLLSPPQTLSSSGQDALDPHVEVDLDGDAVFMWRRSNGSTFLAQTRARSAGGVLSGVQTLSPAIPFDVFEPQLAVDPDGDAVFVWRRFDSPVDRIQARVRSSSGALSDVQTISPAGQNASRPDVGVDAAGNAVFTWNRSDHGTGQEEVFVIQTRERTATGSLLAVQTLSDSEHNSLFPDIAVAPDGEAAVTWLQLDPFTIPRVEAAMRP